MMEVKTTAEASISAKSALTYGAIAAVLVVGLLLPSFAFDGYVNVVNTVLLVLLVGLGGREVVSALLSFTHTDSPEIPSDVTLPDVSVVIPAYNEAAVLPDTIEACRSLEYPEKHLEVILCYEAASTDATAEIAQRAAETTDCIVAIERDEPGGGKAKATNYALRYATGDIIASIDADHRFKPDAVRRAVARFMTDEDIWCVKGRCYGRNPTDSLLSLHATVERHMAEKADIFAREVVGGFTIFGGGQAFFRADLFERLGPFDEEVLVEDIDMSARIHRAGKEICVDPDIITYEENPATPHAWWNQRKRWARGWMQVATRYLPLLHHESQLSTRQKADAAFTFTYAVVPAAFILLFPISGLDLLGQFDTTAYIPNAWLFWALLTGAPPFIAYSVFVQDWLAGNDHHPYEYLAAFTLGPYLMLQTVVYTTAFIDEFVLDRPSVYITTARSGTSSS